MKTAQGWLYLAGVRELCSCRLIGWAMGSSLETALPPAALHRALRQRQPGPGLLHHSDRGCQYDSAPKMPFGNTLKHELMSRCDWANPYQTNTGIFDYSEGFYNRTHLHSTLGYQSPHDYKPNLNSPNINHA